MLGGTFRASYVPLNDNIINGRIRGVAGVVGCTNPRVKQDWVHVELVKELIKKELIELGPMSRQERWVAVIFASVAISWISRGLFDVTALSGVSDASIAMAGFISLKRLEPILVWKCSLVTMRQMCTGERIIPV